MAVRDQTRFNARKRFCAVPEDLLNDDRATASGAQEP